MAADRACWRRCLRPGAGRAPGRGAAAGETAPASKGATVDINNFAFHPPTLTVAKGTHGHLLQLEQVTHTATRGGGFDTGLIKPGKSVAVRFTQKGTFAYHCTIHPLDARQDRRRLASSRDMDRGSSGGRRWCSSLAVAVLSIVLGLALPHDFFVDWGWIAGPGSWLLCAAFTARVLAPAAGADPDRRRPGRPAQPRRGARRPALGRRDPRRRPLRPLVREGAANPLPHLKAKSPQRVGRGALMRGTDPLD